MSLTPSFNLLPNHAALWAKLQPTIQQGRLTHAYLMYGQNTASVRLFVNRFVAATLCQATEAPCGSCQICGLLTQSTHPDVITIQPETANTSIKIDQIRLLQQDIYQTPHCGNKRFVIIEPADKLNQAAQHALLKILEEPPQHSIFILIASFLNLPATILSRCQKYRIDAGDDLIKAPLDVLFNEQSPARKALFAERSQWLARLNELAAGKLTPCDIAAQWSSYELEEVVWFLYLLTAQVLEYRLTGNMPIPSDPHHVFAKSQSLMRLFKQLDKMSELFVKIQQNIVLNQTLALESLLLGYAHAH